MSATIPSKEEQTKSVTITENGTTTVEPDEGKALASVEVTTNVPSIFKWTKDGSHVQLITDKGAKDLSVGDTVMLNVPDEVSVPSEQDVDFTQNSSLPTSTTVNALAVFNNKLYVGTASSGIYVSSDGSTFTKNTSFPASTTVNALAVFDNKLYVGTESHGIYVSSDGSTFTQNSSLPTSTTVNAFAVFDNKLYVGTNRHGIYSGSVPLQTVMIIEEVTDTVASKSGNTVTFTDSGAYTELGE